MGGPRSNTSKALPTHVALLRGINVGGKRIVPMKQLASIFSEAGCSDVSTLIQSGNVLFRATAALAKDVASMVPPAIGKHFGFEPVVVVRSRGQMASIIAGNPFGASEAEVAALSVGFLADTPGKKQVASLDPNRSPGDRFAVRGGVIYLHLPNGAARTKLTSVYLDSTLGTTCTVRNWRTVTKLGTLLGVE